MPDAPVPRALQLALSFQVATWSASYYLCGNTVSPAEPKSGPCDDMDHFCPPVHHHRDGPSPRENFDAKRIRHSVCSAFGGDRNRGLPFVLHAQEAHGAASRGGKCRKGRKGRESREGCTSSATVAGC